MAAIELHGVSKRYDDVVAVEDLDLGVKEGEVFGFLGPNGAGKSTTINMLLDFVHPSEGTIEVLGYDAHADSLRVRERIGVLPEGFDVYDRLTGRKHVELAIDSKEASDDADALLERVGIADAADRKAGDYSKGMTQRLALAMALAGSPDLLILDEPSTGLDPNGALEMREIVREEVERGATVFFSSHILGQVEAVCDRVGILREGRLVAEDSVSGLRKAAGTDATLRITVGELPSRALDRVRALEGVSGVEQDGSVLRVGVEDGSKTAVLSTLEEEGAEVRDFETEEASLEDLFRAYTEGAA
ncbi:trehalose/maltose import ATP-binding protein MalK [Halalkalicoccus paucihalophilus]|uniref:Trehalose/maltose import ATP-binding protein MalK n=1 Tax=Halalkalicoccus paucihalophilus TaxID=1008153 RepID=A0A151AHA6_9EURY|nr:ABC transporter ATP-binding protein [Halalkalicoccus paucihalophilus]KYH26993.1 trehalose/maltose import ATP-binding protein MalK [Halalkalicoccus paucihalophilus]